MITTVKLQSSLIKPQHDILHNTITTEVELGYNIESTKHIPHLAPTVELLDISTELLRKCEND